MAGPHRQSLEEKLARHRVVRNGCWGWSSSKSAYGYGWVRHGDRTLLAHRAAYEVANGPIPAGMVVRHSCDTPECTNPAHLLLGTHADNVADKVARGRQYRGDRHSCCKVKEADLPVALQLRKDGLSWGEIAKRFGVSRDAVRQRLAKEELFHP